MCSSSKYRQAFSKLEQISEEGENMSNLRRLRPDLAKKSEERNNEVSSRVQDDLEIFRKWVKAQDHLLCRVDDQYLVGFMRCCKFNLDAAKRRIDDYLTCRTVYFELFLDWRVDRKTLDIVKTGINLVLQDPMPYSGHRLFMTQLVHVDPKLYTYLEIFKVLFMIFEMTAFEDDYTTINGVEYILDLEDCNVQCCGRLDSVTLKKIYNYMAQCVPFRLVRVHVINMKPELEVYHNFGRNVLPAQLPFELIVHEDMKSLYLYIPQFALTAEYGGQNGTVHEIIIELTQKMEEHEAFFERDVYYKSVERHRQGPITSLQVDFTEERKFKKYEVY